MASTTDDAIRRTTTGGIFMQLQKRLPARQRIAIFGLGNLLAWAVILATVRLVLLYR